MPAFRTLFAGIDSSNQSSLWVTDGTDAGTSELAVANAYTGTGGLNPTNLVSFNGRVYFKATDAAGHNGLWVSDGTAAGTTELVIPGAFSGGITPGNPIVFNGKLYFTGFDASIHSVLWVSDGTAAGTSVLPITGTASNGINAQQPVIFGNQLMFAGRDPSGLPGLWISDGTGPGTTFLPVTGGNATNGLQPTNLVSLGNKVVFAAVDAANSKGLWVTDGTAAGTSELIIPGASSIGGFQPRFITAFNGKAYFQGFTSQNVSGLWVTDGTVAGTTELAVPNAGALTGLQPQYIVALGSQLLFLGKTSANQGQLWSSDGTAAGTVPLTVAGANQFGLGPSGLTVIGNQVYFAGNDPSANRTLWVTDGTAAGTVQINATGVGPAGISPSNFAALGSVTTGGGLPCFAQGTRIATSRGPVPVEDLRIGDMVVTATASRPIRWLGHRGLRTAAHPAPHDVLPVRVATDAFGPGQPAHPLRLSPDHAVFVDDHLVPIRYLLNGATIAQEDCDAITYWHVELDQHDILIAEGLPAESYLDTGNRSDFANGGPVARMSPAFALRTWETDACAPLLRDGPALAAIRARLKARALVLGHRISADPLLRIRAGARNLPPRGETRRPWIALPPGITSITLASRTGVPAQIGRDSTDHRRLGLCVTRLEIDGEVLALDDPRLTEGWYPPENGAAARWTDGAAVIASPVPMHNLRLELAPALSYWIEPAQPAKRAKLAVSTL